MTGANGTQSRVVVRLRRDARLTVEAAPSTGLSVAGPFCTITFDALPAGIRGALETLTVADRTKDELGAQVATQDGLPALLRFHRLLGRLDHEGLLEHTVLRDEEPLARLRPVGRGATSWRAAPATGGSVKLSRFAVVRAEGGLLVARAPGSHLALELTAGAAGLLAALAAWSDPGALGEAVPELAGSTARDVLTLFDAAGLLSSGAPAADPETDSQAGAQWSATDLWLHARSRGPRTVAGYGGTYRDAERFAPLPAAPPALGTRRIELSVPDLAAVARRDPPLTEVIESRRSVREHDASNPVTVDQLGELLYRAARQRQTFDGSDGQELADRPYPSGGAVHELEVYPLINRCDGADAGLWHYRSDEHALELVTDPGPATETLLTGARDGAVMDSDPQVVLLIAARFGRIMWKYEAVSYSLILKHVGVLYQTIYLIGTAMNLAICGLGGGDAAQFAAATGQDMLAECSVGELVLGSRPAVLVSEVGVLRAQRTEPEPRR